MNIREIINKLNKINIVDNIHLARSFNINLSSIDIALEQCKQLLIHTEIGSFEIAKILEDAFNKNSFDYQFEFNLQNNPQVNPGQAGEYGIQDAFINQNGIININLYDDIYLIFEDITNNEYNWFCKYLKSTIAHELIHYNQLAQSEVTFNQVDRSNNTSYLSSKQEIQAFAVEAVTDYINLGYEKDKIYNLLRNPFNSKIPSRTESDSFWNYTEYFDINDLVFKLFIKYCYQYLETFT